MGIRKTTQRDDRRRRVLVDERILTPSREETAKASTAPSSGPARRYAEAAMINRQPRICSFVPIRRWTLSIWFLAGLCFVMAHATAFALMVRYTPANMPIDLAPIDLTGPRALSNWSASLMLMLAALISVLIVQFRQHRIDDYRGEYRVWYYVVAGLVLASMNASTAGHQILLQAANDVASTYRIRHATLWTHGLVSIAVTGVCVRMLLEVRSSRGTVATGTLAGAAYLCHALLTTIWPISSAELQSVSVGLARLTGHYLLVMSLVVYSRYVVLDSQGQIAQKAAKKKKTARNKRKATDESHEQPAKPSGSKPSRAARKARSQPTLDKPAHDQQQASQPAPARPARPAEPTPSQPSLNVDDHDDEEPATLKMSKSERRKSRKQKRRDRRAA